ncbi:ankyrin repeat domain-containing protein [uncultured Phenylobacterium sp.]|uniref:ankyrin repeat domain-containing protein n=1 Tax=uncultured Phenylobacterium sp. TaxID=349273 RepID=UPI0025DA6467|nr:ankyrin repeat domain-containing protein [uncultured Phenylobacterium sp.]
MTTAYNSVHDVLRRFQDVVEFLDTDLVSVDQKGIFGNTPLAIAAGWGDVQAVALLIAAGADVDAKVEDGDTPLHRAVSFGHADVVRLLIENRASAGIRNDDGLSALDAALVEADPLILQLVRGASTWRGGQTGKVR